MPPSFWASAMACRASVVLPLDSGPKTSITRPRGKPWPPSAMSSARLPVEMPSMATALSTPRGMIAPSPNCFSMAATVFRSSTLDSSTLVGFEPAARAAFLDGLSGLLSDLAMRVLLEGVVPGAGRWLVATRFWATVTMNKPFIYENRLDYKVPAEAGSRELGAVNFAESSLLWLAVSPCFTLAVYCTHDYCIGVHSKVQY